jgi:hypothetical protein
MQIDGQDVTLLRLALSCARYSGAGVILKISKTGSSTLKRARR